MNTLKVDAIPADLMAELQQAAERAARGIRDPETMRRACADMAQIGKEIREKHGVLDLAVPAIRALRDGEDS